MEIFKRMGQVLISAWREFWLLPRSVCTALRLWRREAALEALEAERLDRIRNPSKYLGK